MIVNPVDDFDDMDFDGMDFDDDDEQNFDDESDYALKQNFEEEDIDTFEEEKLEEVHSSSSSSRSAPSGSSSDSDDDDYDDVDPGDVEADLEEILRGRIAASGDLEDDEEEEDEEFAAPSRKKKSAGSVTPPLLGEWMCNQCFLIVSAGQFGHRRSPVCPFDEDPCESVEQLLNG